jgi:hypothetical protein
MTTLKRSILRLLILFAACFLHAQTVSPFMGIGDGQFFDNNGNLLLSGVLYSYQAGTSTQQATYTDHTGLIANPNPLPFGSGARVSIWLLSTVNYKFVLCLQNDGSSCAPADVLFSMDFVPGCMGCSSGGGGGGGGSPFIGTFISGTAIPATTGILELASIDSICWRNTANNANLCISKDSSNVLTWSGSVIKLPETGCSVTGSGQDYLCPDSGNHRFLQSGNGVAYKQIVNAGVDINTSDQVTQLHFGASPVPLCSSLGSGLLGWNGTSICNENVTNVTFGSTTLSFNSTPPTSGQLLEYDGTHISGVAPLAEQIETKQITTGICTTGTGAYASCGTSFTWPVAFADASYSLTCTTNAASGSGALTFVWWSSKTASGATVNIQNGDSSGAAAETVTEIDCTGVHL